MANIYGNQMLSSEAKRYMVIISSIVKNKILRKKGHAHEDHHKNGVAQQFKQPVTSDEK